MWSLENVLVRRRESHTHWAVASLQMALIGTFQILTFVKLQGFQTEPAFLHQPELVPKLLLLAEAGLLTPAQDKSIHYRVWNEMFKMYFLIQTKCFSSPHFHNDFAYTCHLRETLSRSLSRRHMHTCAQAAFFKNLFSIGDETNDISD